MIFPLSSFCFYFYPTAWTCNLHCSLLISRLIFIFCQQNERSATDETPERPPRCLGNYGPDNLDVSEHLAIEEARSPGHHWSRPGRHYSPKCLRFANTLFFLQQNKPQTFLSFCKNKICTEGSNLNDKPIGFVWLWCLPKVQEKHIWSLGSFSFCFREGIFLCDHSKLETQIQISHLGSHCCTIVIKGQSPSTPQRGYSQNLFSETRVSQHCGTDKT